MSQASHPDTIIIEKQLVRRLARLDDDVEITFTDIGWTSRVYMVNQGEVVFKFPRTDAVREEYLREMSAYKIARDVAADDVLVPEICWEHAQGDYLGYRGIVGRPLDEVLGTLTGSEKHMIGERLGAFLHRFHRVDLKDAQIMTLERECDEYAHKLALGRSRIERHFAPVEVDRIERLVLEEYPRRMKQLGFERGLCHADLGFWNVIHCPDGRIGLIDFGDVGYYDTSIDFAGMSDEHLLNAALGVYHRALRRGKVALRMKLLPILDLPFFLGKQDESGVKKTLVRIRETALT